MRTWIMIGGLTTLLSACHLGEPQIPTRVSEPQEELSGPGAIRPFLESYRREPGGPPSISVAVAVDGEVVLASAVGWADEAEEIPATPETRYRTYSISKAVTSVAILQLVESGAVSLDDPVRKYVPQFPDKGQPITVGQLLTHTSGIRHYKPNAGEISSREEYPSLADSLAVFGDDPLEFAPGTGYRYTSFGFNLLTGVIESASGQSFGDYLAERVFGPAGAHHSGLDRATQPDPGRATAYWQPGRRIAKLPNVSGRYGSSGVLSTPSDLARILIALEDDRLLRPETRERMLTAPYPELAADQALGWNLEGEGCRQVAYRSGAGTGYTGLLIHYPRLGIGGAVLANRNQWKKRVPVLEGILDYYVERLAAERCPPQD